MNTRQKRAAAWLPVLLLAPVGLLVGQGLGCELLVDVDRSLVDGSPGGVVLPTTLDGYDCPICTDVAADADFDGDEAFPEDETEDSSAEASGGDADAGASAKDARADMD